MYKPTEKTGVVLANLGTPNAPTPTAVRHYLSQFLSDQRVIELPKIVWQPILHGLILRTRPQKTAKLYQRIWMKEGSPLFVISKRLQKKLQNEIKNTDRETFEIILGMRYGNPSLGEAIQRLLRDRAKKIIILPLYPQYSATTTAAVFDIIVEKLMKSRWIPELHFMNHYFNYPAYIKLLANRIREHWKNKQPAKKLLFSFHGLPKRNIAKGDPYYDECQTTTNLLADELGLDKSEYQIVFQSRFGKQAWLEPYCDKTLVALAKKGIKSVDVICPGFPIDCLETLEEINITNHTLFVENGGEIFNFIPGLNDGDDHVMMLIKLIKKFATAHPY